MPSLRARINRGDVLIGPMALIGSPVVVEIFGHVGFDVLFIDTEHAPTSPYGTELEGLIRAATAAGIPAIVRPTEPRPGAILKALNFGAEGIWLTHTQTPEEAQVAVAACRYPPDGSRSSVPVTRAARYGLEPWDDYRQRVNREVLAMPIIESAMGIQNVDQIAAVPGVDMLQFGPFDLSTDLRVPPGNFYGTDSEWIDPQLEDAFKACARAAEKHGIGLSTVAWNAESAERQIEMGAQMILMGIDLVILQQNVTAVLENANALKRANA